MCCGALGALPAGHVAGANLGEVQPAAEHGFHKARFPRLAAGTLHVYLHTRIAGEVALDKGLRGGPFDAELGGKAEGAHAVNKSEIYCLDVAPLLARNVLAVDAENLRRRGAVYVLAGGKGLDEAFVAG